MRREKSAEKPKNRFKEEPKDRLKEKPKERRKERPKERPSEKPKEQLNEKPKKNITRRIVIGISIAVVLIFVVFLFITTNFLGNNMMVTETAYRSVAYDVVKTTALVVRDEEYIPASNDGVLVYSVSDGDKVTAGGTIATAYNSEDDVVKMQRISELDEKIAFLQSLSTVSQNSSIGLDTVNTQINEKMVSLISHINTNSFEFIGDVEDELMTSIYRKQLITGEQGKFDDKIAQLKAEKAELEASAGAPSGKVTTPASGYFVSSVDGYENSVAVSDLNSFYYSDYKKLRPADVDPDAYLGKILKGVNWYLVCPVTADEATNISHNSTYVSVRMPYALSEEIPAKVMYVNNLAGEERSIVVLRCNYMSDALSKIRKESVEIVVNSYEGLRVSKSAIHDAELTRTVTDENKVERTETKVVQGVYVEYGNELRFRQIVIDFSGDDYVICNENPDPELLFKGSTITLYDQVVTEGGDLYDGKLIK